METGITKNQLVAELTKSLHGRLENYLPIGRAAAKQEPEFLGHLIAWNALNGSVRDSKVALPVLALSGESLDPVLAENALAHMAALDPRNFVRATEFYKAVGIKGHGKTLRKLVERYLRSREEAFPVWERMVIQHRRSVKTLYARFHVKPSAICNNALFGKKYPPGSTLGLIPQLRTMPVKEAAGYIFQRKIPFLVAVGALGEKLKDPDTLLAIITQMSPAELTTNMKMLENLGVKNNPALRGALEDGLKRMAAAPKGRTSALKTSKAIEAVADEGTKARLQATQEKQLKTLGGVEGDWLVLGDRSSSMEAAVETAKEVAAVLAKMVKGKVHLVFFNDSPRYFDATGKTLEAIKDECRLVSASGWTSIGCGLELLVERGLQVQGIAIVSDGCENRHPLFSAAYRRYVAKFDHEPMVYWYKLGRGASHANLALPEMETFDLREGVDYYSLPNLVATMNTRRYTLADAIMETPLLTFEKVFRI